MSDTGPERTTLGGIATATAGVLRRKGLLLALLAVLLSAAPQILAIVLAPHADGVLGMFNLQPQYGWMQTLARWLGMAAAFSAIVAVTLSDLQADGTTPRVLATKSLVRWPPMLLISAVLNLPGIAAAVVIVLLMANPWGRSEGLVMLVGLSWLVVLPFAAFYGLAAPVLLQERGGVIRSLWRAWRLSRGARVALVVLALVWSGAPDLLRMLIAYLGGALALPWLGLLNVVIRALIDGLWAVALAVAYLKQRRSLGQPPAHVIGEVFD
jgi:hypothetical protein